MKTKEVINQHAEILEQIPPNTFRNLKEYYSILHSYCEEDMEDKQWEKFEYIETYTLIDNKKFFNGAACYKSAGQYGWDVETYYRDIFQNWLPWHIYQETKQKQEKEFSKKFEYRKKERKGTSRAKIKARIKNAFTNTWYTIFLLGICLLGVASFKITSTTFFITALIYSVLYALGCIAYGFISYKLSRKPLYIKLRESRRKRDEKKEKERQDNLNYQNKLGIPTGSRYAKEETVCHYIADDNELYVDIWTKTISPEFCFYNGAILKTMKLIESSFPYEENVSEEWMDFKKYQELYKQRKNLYLSIDNASSSLIVFKHNFHKMKKK